MADYIDRKTALSFPFANEQYDHENANEDFILGCETYKEWLENLPIADAQEVRHGEWLLEREPNGKPYCFHCSVCDSDFGRISIVSATPFCPWCGAKMDVKGE